MSFPEPQFVSRSQRGQRQPTITVREFLDEGPSLENCTCKVCGPCVRDAERHSRWCRGCIKRKCWRRHEHEDEKGPLGKLISWLSKLGGGKKKKKKKKNDDRGESTVYYYGEGEQQQEEGERR
ncbi:hypothetical protein VTH82DRAFT_1114 [Thermothelomyces myriococcoides]